MRIALAQAAVRNGDMAFNLAQMERYMAEAKRRGADLACFGEMFLQGFDCLCWDFDRDRSTAVSTDSEAMGVVRRLSRRLEVDVLLGYAELDGEAIYSSCALVCRGEIIRNYRRVTRGWKEWSRTDMHYREGQEVAAFDYRGARCAIALCGDLWDCPERFRLGQDLLFWPVYTCWSPREWEETERREYAEQAGRCGPAAVLVNSICEDGAQGGSAYFINGAVRAGLPMEQEGMLVVEWPPERGDGDATHNPPI